MLLDMTYQNFLFLGGLLTINMFLFNEIIIHSSNYFLELIVALTFTCEFL